MLSVFHTIISLPFGVYMGSPLLAFLAAFAMHLLSDTFLHWNIFPWRFKRYPYELVALDVFGGVFVSWMLLGQEIINPLVIAAIAGGNMPDILHGLWDMIGKENQRKYFGFAAPAFAFHDRLQLETLDVAQGLVWQCILGALAVLLIVFRL